MIGCRVDRLRLSRADGYRVDPEALQQAPSREPDLAVLVNPNSPTGQHLPRVLLESVLKGAPDRVRIWVDEAYGAGVGPIAFRIASRTAIRISECWRFFAELAPGS